MQHEFSFPRMLTAIFFWIATKGSGGSPGDIHQPKCSAQVGVGGGIAGRLDSYESLNQPTLLTLAPKRLDIFDVLNTAKSEMSTTYSLGMVCLVWSWLQHVDSIMKAFHGTNKFYHALFSQKLDIHTFIYVDTTSWSPFFTVCLYSK